MYTSIPYANRSQVDRIPPEKFPRIQIDRNIHHINDLFRRGLDSPRTPIQLSVDRVQSAGSVALLDVGCGTGNTLRTWKLATKLSSNAPESISATGITLHDYHKESASRHTEAAIRKGEINYLVGDAEDHLARLHDDQYSADVVLAFNSLIHMSSFKADRVLRGVVGLLSPGGAALFNLSPQQCVSNSPPMEQMYALDDAGYETDIRPVTLRLKSGFHDYHLGYIKKPD